jgi:U3 small nucleolar RNA-associated protein 4
MEDGFSVGQSPAKSRHNLLFWVWFGGPEGSYLQYLTGISVTRSKGGFGGIEFHFSTDRVPITSRKLGLCDDKQGPDFAIDGAGGEYITFVYGKLPQMPYLPALVVCHKQALRVD